MFEFIVGYFSFCQFECNEYFIFSFKILKKLCLLIVIFICNNHTLSKELFLHISHTLRLIQSTNLSVVVVAEQGAEHMETRLEARVCKYYYYYYVS